MSVGTGSKQKEILMASTTTKPAPSRKPARSVVALRLAVPVRVHRELAALKVDLDEPIYRVAIRAIEAGLPAIKQSQASA